MTVFLTGRPKPLSQGLLGTSDSAPKTQEVSKASWMKHPEQMPEAPKEYSEVLVNDQMPPTFKEKKNGSLLYFSKLNM